MAERISQSVAKTVVFRAFVTATGLPATGKTIAITISKNGATSFSNPAAGALNATEMASGFYKFALGTGDTDTLGPLAYRGAEGTIDDVGDVFTVDAPLATTTNITGGTITTVTNLTNAPTNGDLTATMKTSVTTAATAATPTAAAVTGAVGSVTGAVGSVTGNVGGNVTGSVGSVSGAVGSVTGNVGGNVAGSVASVTAGVTVTTNNDKTGYALASAPPSAAVIAAAVWDLTTTGHTTSGTFGAAMNAAGSAGDPWGTLVPGAYGAGTAGAILGAVANGVTLTSGERTTFADVVLTRQVTEAYRANGAAPTLANGLCELLGHHSEASVSGTTLTVKGFDHTTVKMTFTLNDAVTPTSVVRAT